MTEQNLVPKHGGYRSLKTFQLGQLAYDLTVVFCDIHVDKRSRTYDQMVQAARSGVQNIAEGSQASGTSKKTEIKLTNVARASLEELLLDYEDRLRHHELPKWERADPRREGFVRRRCGTVSEIQAWANEVAGRKDDLEALANAAITLLAVTTTLLDRQIAAQAKAFEEEGGFTERMYQRRLRNRGR